MRIAIVLLAALCSAAAQELKFADLGTCKLASGQQIQDCRIGYRTFGSLNADKSNVVLWPTWFSGTTEDLVGKIGAGKLLDPSGLYVITVDALGDGVSSSPSNSKAQPRLNFPRITIHDMVESQRRLLTEKLGIPHVRAVMGISMGGMQTFEWMTAFPDFMDRAIPIVGSPQLSSYDLLLWEAEARAIESDKDWNGGNYTAQPPLKAVRDMHMYALTTPESRVKEVGREQARAFIQNTENPQHLMDANDWLRQLQAMIGHDVAAGTGGNLREAAGRVKAKVLNIVALHDHMVNPTTAMRYADMLGAKTIVLEGDCGHLAPDCELSSFGPALNEFIRK